MVKPSLRSSNFSTPRPFLLAMAVLVGAAGAVGAGRLVYSRVGKQPDGSFIVATEQRIEPGAIPFIGRPIDMAEHPSGAVAVLDHSSVIMISKDGMSVTPLWHSAGFRGAVWSPDGKRLFVSMSMGYVQ